MAARFQLQMQTSVVRPTTYTTNDLKRVDKWIKVMNYPFVLLDTLRGETMKDSRTAPIPFGVWKKAVDRELLLLADVVSDDIPDYDYARDFQLKRQPKAVAKSAWRNAVNF